MQKMALRGIAVCIQGVGVLAEPALASVLGTKDGSFSFSPAGMG